MGSFAYTCALSELPIEAGDQCRIIPLVRSRLGLNGGACSAMELVFPPIKGFYDDYGYADNLEATAFQEQVAQVLGYPTTAQFAESLKQGQVSTANRTDSPTAAVYSLVREDAWEAMLSMPGEMYDLNFSRTEAHAQMTLALQEGTRFFTQSKYALEKDQAGDNLVQLMSKGDPTQAVRILSQFVLGGMLDSYPAFNSVFWHFLAGYNSLYRNINLTELLVDWSLKGATEQQMHDALSQMGEQILINSNMNAIRKVWLCRNSSGPQSGEHALHLLWAKKLVALSSTYPISHDSSTA